MKKHVYKIITRWGDIDAFGHVNNATYLTYIQEARVDFTWYARQRRDEKPLLLDMVVARAEVDYVSPIYDGHKELEIAVWKSVRFNGGPLRCWPLPKFSAGSELLEHLLRVLS
jgi:acyl-CoA thioesterase FadM